MLGKPLNPKKNKVSGLWPLVGPVAWRVQAWVVVAAAPAGVSQVVDGCSVDDGDHRQRVLDVQALEVGCVELPPDPGLGIGVDLTCQVIA